MAKLLKTAALLVVVLSVWLQGGLADGEPEKIFYRLYIGRYNHALEKGNKTEKLRLAKEIFEDSRKQEESAVAAYFLQKVIKLAEGYSAGYPLVIDSRHQLIEKCGQPPKEHLEIIVELRKKVYSATLHKSKKRKAAASCARDTLSLARVYFKEGDLRKTAKLVSSAEGYSKKAKSRELSDEVEEFSKTFEHEKKLLSEEKRLLDRQKKKPDDLKRNAALGAFYLIKRANPSKARPYYEKGGDDKLVKLCDYATTASGTGATQKNLQLLGEYARELVLEKRGNPLKKRLLEMTLEAYEGLLKLLPEKSKDADKARQIQGKVWREYQKLTSDKPPNGDWSLSVKGKGFNEGPI